MMRPLVEYLGHIVAGSADKFYATLEGRMVGLGADKGGQKRVMNIDDLLLIASHELGGENLHIPCEHDEFNLVFLEQRELLFFRSGLVGRADRNMMKGHIVEIGQSMSVFVIADHQRDVTRQLSNLMAIEKVDKAMLITGNEDGDGRPLLAHRYLPSKSIVCSQRGKGGGERPLVKVEAGQRPLNAHEKEPQRRILVLVRMQDVSAMFQDESRNGKDQAFAILTIQQQRGGIFQWFSSGPEPLVY